LVVNITYSDPLANSMTMTMSGSFLVVSDEGNDLWEREALPNDLWRIMFRDTETVLRSAGFAEYSVGPGITASVAGGASINLNTVFFANNGSNRDDFSIGFDANPDPFFAIGQTVVIAGTALINLGADTAGIYNYGRWTDTAITGPEFFSTQIAPFNLDLTISSGAPVPEPATWMAGILLAAFASYRRFRKA
jgi:hypothetical protein